MDIPSTVHCPQCGYDLRGAAQGRCPECGFGYDEPAVIALVNHRYAERIWTYRRMSVLASLALVLALAGKVDRFIVGAAATLAIAGIHAAGRSRSSVLIVRLLFGTIAVGVILAAPHGFEFVALALLVVGIVGTLRVPVPPPALAQCADAAQRRRLILWRAGAWVLFGLSATALAAAWTGAL